MEFFARVCGNLSSGRKSSRTMTMADAMRYDSGPAVSHRPYMGVVSLLVVAAFVSGCGDGASKVKSLITKERSSEPIAVRVIRVDYTPDATSTTLVGSVEPSGRAVLSTSYPGHLEHIYVGKGERVREGQVLLQIDAQSVNSAYEVAKAAYDQASDALSRVEQVYQSGSVTEIRLMEVQTAFAKAEAALRSAQKALEDCSIKAPFDGIIGDIYPHEGMELQALAPVAEILDISRLEVSSSVPENEYSIYSTGMKVRIDVPAAGVTLDGVLEKKGIEASKVTRSYECTFSFAENPRFMGVMPGMVCKVRLTGNGPQSIVIPASSVMVDGDGRYVWCIVEGTVLRKHITAGGFSGEGIIVESGLELGDMVVTDGSRKISEGMSGVRIIE